MSRRNGSDDYLTPAQLVERWNGAVTIRTLANWRSANPKRGPSFTKIGSRVRYSVANVVRYESKNTSCATHGALK